MINDRQIVGLIEQINDEQPFCPCGMHTTPVWRDGVVWLECASLSKPRRHRITRILAEVLDPAHVRKHIVDVPAAPVDLAS
jgi:hypothetical protein